MARVWILAPGDGRGGVLMVSRAYLHTGMRMEGFWWGGVSAPRDGEVGCGCCRVYLHAGMKIGSVDDRVYLLPGMGVGDGRVLVRRVYLHRRMGLEGCW